MLYLPANCAHHGAIARDSLWRFTHLVLSPVRDENRGLYAPDDPEAETHWMRAESPETAEMWSIYGRDAEDFVDVLHDCTSLATAVWYAKMLHRCTALLIEYEDDARMVGPCAPEDLGVLLAQDRATRGVACEFLTGRAR